MLLFTLSAMAAGLVLTPLIIRLAVRLNFVDEPTQPHKSHQKPVPYLGGLVIVLSSATVLPVILLFPEIQTKQSFRSEAILLLLPAIVLFLVGLYDDYFALNVRTKFFLQLSVVVPTVVYIQVSYSFASPFMSPLLDSFSVLLFLIGTINATNFVDNQNGHLLTFSSISLIAIGLIIWSTDQSLMFVMSLCLLGSCLGLFWWNIRGKLFLGDAGSLFIGFCVGFLLLRADLPTSTSKWPLVILPYLFGIVYLDIFSTLISRVIEGRRITTAGQDHISHTLLHYGLKKSRVIIIMTSIHTLMSIEALAFFYFSILSKPSDNTLNLLSLVLILQFLFLISIFVRFRRRILTNDSTPQEA